jgi:hypothetical protein
MLHLFPEWQCHVTVFIGHILTIIDKTSSSPQQTSYAIALLSQTRKSTTSQLINPRVSTKPTMKITFILFLAMIYHVAAKTDLAVRVYVSHQGECSDEDIEVVQSGVMSLVSLEPLRRNLRERRLDPWYCATVCRNFPKGTCWLAYPLCKSYRRQMKKDDAVKIDSAEKLPNGENIRECFEMKSKIQSEIELEADWVVEISPSCKQVLKSNVDLKCFRVNDS